MLPVTESQQYVSPSNVDTEIQPSVATLNVCRVCLAVNVKMYHMSEHKLNVMYEQVTGVEINTEDKLPRMLCWECVARLSSANNFIVKAFKTHSILMKKLNRSKLVTISDVESINRLHYKLASTLGFKYSKENDTNFYNIKENDEDNDHINIKNYVCYEERVPVSHEVIDKSIRIKDEHTSDENFTFKSENLEGSVEENVPDENYKEPNISGEKDKTKCQNTNSVIRMLEISNEDNISDEEMTIDNMSNVNDMFEEKHHTLGEATGTFEEIKLNGTVESNLGSEPLPPCKELRVVLEDIMLTLSKYNTQDTLKQITGLSSNASTAHNQIKKELLEQKINFVDKADDSETSETVFICDICDKKFDIKSNLIRHITEHSKYKKVKTLTNMHEKNIVFICDYCGYTCLNKHHLSGHINSMHTKAVSYKFSHCSYEAYHQNSLYNHVHAKHTKTDAFYCSLCSFKTHRQLYLHRHINVEHTQTHRKSNVAKHVKAKHTSTKVHNCSLCSYKSYKKGDVNSHINAKHSKSISYDCSHCSYKAYHRGNLNKHINSKHTKTEAFYCSLCNHKTYRKSNLIVHLKAKHAGTS